jgi:hypothetical protein
MLAWGGRLVTQLGLDHGYTEALGRIDDVLARFYRSAPWRLVLSIACHLAAWLLGSIEAWLILTFLGVPTPRGRGRGAPARWGGRGRRSAQGDPRRPALCRAQADRRRPRGRHAGGEIRGHAGTAQGRRTRHHLYSQLGPDPCERFAARARRARAGQARRLAGARVVRGQGASAACGPRVPRRGSGRGEGAGFRGCA